MIIPAIYLVVSLATIFTVLALVHKEVIEIVLSIVTWLVAAISSAVVGIPYLIYNPADNTVFENIQQVTGGESYLAWLFLGFAIIMTVYLAMEVTEKGTKEARRFG